MSVVSAVLEKLRGKRQEQVKTVWQQYHTMVRDLATDQQVDVDELALCMDQLDKSDADLEADIERQRERTGFAAQHAEYLRLCGEVPKLEQAHEKAKAEYSEAVNKLQPKVMAAFTAWNSAHHQMLALTSVEGRLLESCRDPNLLDRQNEIHAKRTELTNELRLLIERSPVKHFEQLNSRLEKLKYDRSKMDKQNSPTYWRENAANIEHVEGNVKTYQELVQQFERRRSEIKSEMAGLERQLADIRQKMLVP